MSFQGCAFAIVLLSSLKSVPNNGDLFDNKKLPTCEAERLRRVFEAFGGRLSFSGTDDRGVCR